VKGRAYVVPPLLAAALALGGVSACSSGSAATTPGNSQGPELSTITVQTTDIADAASLILAIKEGYFKQQGLTVKVSYVGGSTESLPSLMAHTTDFAIENYPGAFAQDVSDPHFGLRIVADDTQSVPNALDLMVPKNSSITSMSQLKGKTIAFPAPGVNPGELAIDEEIRAFGLGPNSYSSDPIPFPDMVAPLARGEVDAAFALQPFITIMESQAGAHPLADLMTGPMENFPLVGWGTTAYFVQHYPRTVAAFQRAIEKGLQLAASNPTLVRQTIPTYIPTIKPQIANIMPLDTFNTTLSVTRLQRVADIMEQFKFLPPNFNVKQLVVPLPSGA
jgi:NitT/TauT family transport system substrate-binding protein